MAQTGRSTVTVGFGARAGAPTMGTHLPEERPA